MSGTLYVVATPIGNLGDFSPRARQVLSEVDFIAAEDTRVGGKLLNAFGIKKPQISYFEHNRRQKTDLLCQRMLAGESCALITDAGTPAISDPGGDLAERCHELGIPVVSVPGPSAIIAALSISGIPCGRFTFEGFLSTAARSRREHLRAIGEESRTMVFYEAPHKLRNTLDDLLSALGERDIALCRELTKIHEEVLRMSLSEAVAHYRENEPRGEYVLIIAGKAPREEPEEARLERALALCRARMAGGESTMAAVKEAAKQAGVSKNLLYREIVREE